MVEPKSIICMNVHRSLTRNFPKLKGIKICSINKKLMKTMQKMMVLTYNLPPQGPALILLEGTVQDVK